MRNAGQNRLTTKPSQPGLWCRIVIRCSATGVSCQRCDSSSSPAPCPPFNAQGAPEFDVILRNGTIVDGSGGLPFRGDVAISGVRIAAVGALRGKRGAAELDISGLVVAPGFINIHSHPSPAALPRAENMLTQGVTTEILNADGGGPLDIRTQLSNLQSGWARRQRRRLHRVQQRVEQRRRPRRPAADARGSRAHARVRSPPASRLAPGAFPPGSTTSPRTSQRRRR